MMVVFLMIVDLIHFFHGGRCVGRWAPFYEILEATRKEQQQSLFCCWIYIYVSVLHFDSLSFANAIDDVEAPTKIVGTCPH